MEKVPGPIQLDYVNNRNFDLMYERHRSRDAILLNMMWNSANDVVGGWAWTGFVSTELDSATSKLRTLPNYEDRCNLAHTIQQIIMDNALMIPTSRNGAIVYPAILTISDLIFDPPSLEGLL